jgi:ribosome biogenesis GTPase A
MDQVDQLQSEPVAESREHPARVLSPELKQQFDTLRNLLQRSLWLAERCADIEATQILRARLTNLQAAALLVVVGEVKAGKSSFINALLREDVCEVAPGPCTAGIQELIYGPQWRVDVLGESWQRVWLPKDVLREISIVDTPGTNSIVKSHQTITENYIPQSDLVVFVFSAVNPHTESAWEMLTLIKKDWHRKIVFVLQQSDRATQRELSTNLEHVRQYAKERQVDDPAIFILSAKREMEGIPENAFAEFRSFLQNTIACGEAWRIKVEGSYQTIRSVMTRLLAHLRAEKIALDDERAFYQGLLCQVDAREDKAKGLKTLIVDKLAATYSTLARQSEDEFAKGLRVGKLMRGAIPFLRDKDTNAWLHELKGGFEKSARREIKAEAAHVSMDLFNEMRTMMEDLTQSIARRQERIRADVTFPKATDQLGTLQKLQAKLDGVRIDENILRGKAAETTDVRKLAVAGSLLAILGVVVAAFSPVLWMDITGGIFLGTGIFLVAVGLFWRRNTVLKDFKQRLGDSQQQFRDRLDREFGEIFDGLFYDVRQALTESLFRLDLQASFNTPLLEETFQIGEAASDMVIVSQRLRVSEEPHQPSVAA